MFESHAMMKFLCYTKNLPDHWYPTSEGHDINIKASMDAYLDWHHSNLRMGAGGFMFRKYFSGIMDKNGVWATENAVKDAWNIMETSMRVIEE